MHQWQYLREACAVLKMLKGSCCPKNKISGKQLGSVIDQSQQDFGCSETETTATLSLHDEVYTFQTEVYGHRATLMPSLLAKSPESMESG